MISIRYRAIPQSNDRSFPIDILDLGKFKALLNKQVNQLGIAKRYKPRLYSYADYILVKMYAIIRGISTHDASEELNRHCKDYFNQKFHLHPKIFQDLIRHRRFIPHQTDVDKFFRMMTEQEVQTVFGNLNMHICEKIVTHIGRGQRWRLLVDNTEYAYYGKTKTKYDMGSMRHQGTRRIRLFQGHSLHASDMTLFYDFHLLQKGQYRSKSIHPSVRWLKWNNIPISYALMDREFYRAALIKKLKMEHVPVIIPAKKFKRIQRIIRQYLLGRAPLSSIYYFSQTPKVKPWPSSIHVNMVIVGHNDQPAWIVREAFRKQKLTFNEAYHQLSAFFTTTSPWKDKRAWSKWLTRTYKKRWNQETGFRMLNALHPQFRYQYPTVQLAELYLRGAIYNSWQFFRHQQTRNGMNARQLTLYRYQKHIISQIESDFIQNVIYNLKYMQKRKRRLYFGI